MLDFLTKTTKDMDLLCDNGIVDNYVGDNNAATLIVNNLHKNILWVGLNTDYCKLCESLNAFYKDPRHIWKAILKQDYFSTPWRTATTVAVAILFVLTFIQTVCSILQCEGGRGKESEAVAIEEDDDGEGSGVCVRVHGNEEVEPEVELQKKNEEEEEKSRPPSDGIIFGTP
ncbi:hypothetical protein CFP56_008850 [Quercus suber]|uniref:Transmembrane protein n=1 Tax=Quercus suber TaxID=58331 RepID=A0AAW0L2K6_QUESU